MRLQKVRVMCLSAARVANIPTRSARLLRGVQCGSAVLRSVEACDLILAAHDYLHSSCCSALNISDRR